MARILYVEDDPNLAFATKDNLELSGYDVSHSGDGEDAWIQFQNNQFDLCLVDVMLPKIDGFTLAKKIRLADPHIPILFLTARSLHEDKISGLRLGADDYLTKPFSLQELVLKIEIFLRRSKKENTPQQGEGQLRLGSLAFDAQKLTLTGAGSSQALTFREGEVLLYLAKRANKVVKREELLKEIWGDDDYYMGRSLDVFLSRLRKYLSADPDIRIENVHGVGFRMSW